MSVLALTKLLLPSLAFGYVVLCLVYFWGSEICFNRIKGWADVTQSAVAYTLHFTWGFGIPLAVLFLLYGSGDPEGGALSFEFEFGNILLLVLANVLTWLALCIRFTAIRDMGVEYDRRIAALGGAFGTLGEDLSKEAASDAAKPLNKRGESATGSVDKEGLKEKSLITGGIYSMMRHPGFAAHILQQLGNGFFAIVAFSHVFLSQKSFNAGFGSVVALITALQFLVSFLIFDSAAKSEEKEILTTKSAKEYQAYCARVPQRFGFSVSQVLYPNQCASLKSLMKLVEDFAVKVREGNSRQLFLKAVGTAQGVTMQYVDPMTCPAVVSKMLCMTGDKGTFVEDLIACKAWPPIVSIESVPETISVRMRGKLQKFMARVALDVQAEQVALECIEVLKADLKRGTAKMDNPTISRLTFKIFFKLLTGRDPTASEYALMQEAVDDWKAEIALKQPSKCKDKYAPESLRMRFIKMIADGIKEEKSLVKKALDEDPELAKEWHPTIENLEDLSCLLQPLMVSPIINVGDILAALRNCIDACPAWHAKFLEAAKQGEEAAVRTADMTLMELIRTQHPFPILERYIEKDVNFAGTCPMTGKKLDAPQEAHPCPYIKAGTQVFVEYDQLSMNLAKDFDPERWRGYVNAGKEYEAIKLEDCPYKAVPFGQGPRRCPGQKTARAIVKHLVKFILLEFPPAAAAKKGGRTWEDYRPMDGHKHSGRNNDSEAVDTLHLVKKLGGILVESVYIGMKRRAAVA